MDFSAFLHDAVPSRIGGMIEQRLYAAVEPVARERTALLGKLITAELEAMGLDPAFTKLQVFLNDVVSRHRDLLLDQHLTALADALTAMPADNTGK